MTLYSAVFESPSRVAFAHELGVDSSSERNQAVAGAHADIKTLKAAHALGMPYTEWPPIGAARNNKLAVLQFLHAQHCPLSRTVCQFAAASGRLEVLRWAREHRCDWDARTILCTAVSSGSVEVAAWVKQQEGVAVTSLAMAEAAKHGYTAVCEYLLEQQCPCDTRACWLAAHNDHMHTLRWLREHGCPMPAQIHVAAAESGSVEVMAYLRAEGLLADARKLTCMLNCTGAHNQLAAAQWLRAQGAEWPARLRYMGAMPWSLMALAWARAEGCRSPTTA
jgi:hypothetical protein